MDINALRKRRGEIASRMKELVRDGITDESRSEFDNLEAESKTVKDDIRRLESLEAEDRELRKLAPGPTPGLVVGEGPEDRKFESLGECARAMIRATVKGETDPRLVGMNHRAASGLGESVPSDGGFLLEESYVSGIMRRVYDNPVVSRCRKLTVSGPSNSVTMNAVDETSRVAGSRQGGVLGYWRAEAGTVTATDPKFRQEKIDLNSLAVLAYVTDELLEDVAALNSLLPSLLGEEIEFKLADAIINGTGAGQPLGIANAGALVSVAKESGQTATTIVAANVQKMFTRMYAASRTNAAWLINQDCEPQLWSMSIVAGTAGFPVYLPPGGYSQAPYGSLFGRPVLPMEFAQTLGTTGDIQLLDLDQYLLVTKGGIKQDWSMHVRFIYHEMAFRAVLRVGGQPLWNSALTPYKGSNTVSPYIWLATRS
jgi:HK97 family phage major capsid protein